MLTPTNNKPIPLAGSYTVAKDELTNIPTIETNIKLLVLIHKMPSKMPQIATSDKSPSVAWNGCNTASKGESAKLHILLEKVSKQNRFSGPDIYYNHTMFLIKD